MSIFSIHTAESAPEASRPILNSAARKFGFVPNLLGALADALRRFTATLVEKRGWATDDDVQALLAAGFTRGQALEVVLGIAFKTLSNYANHLIDTPVDAAFAPQAWPAAKAG